jgi:hypothetical protein
MPEAPVEPPADRYRPAAFVRDRKAVTGEADFAAADQADPNRARAGHDDSPVRAAMGAQTGRHAVADKGNGGKGMGDLLESFFSAPAAETGKANSGVHPQKILAREASLCGCRLGGFHNGSPGLVDANPRRGRARARFAEQPAVLVFNTGAAAASAPVDAQIRGTFCCHRKFNARASFGVLTRSDSGILYLEVAALTAVRHSSHAPVTATADEC